MDVNIGYAWGQLLRARQTAAEHADGEVRARAAQTAAKWADVISGMQAGTIAVGSRTPTNAPAWVTLDVVTGGFATGGYGAGGALRDHERALAERLGVPATRLALNLEFLMSAETSELLASGRYRIDVAEEGALLVVAWLRRHNELDRANALVEQLAPWFEALRFYPVPAEREVELKTVRLQDAGKTLEGLAHDVRQRRFETMRAALLVWTPLRDRAIALFAETVVEGAPGRALPEGWHARVEALISDLAQAGKATTARAQDTAELVALLERCAVDPRSLTESEDAHVRRTITRHIAAHGMPGSVQHDTRRAAEREAVTAPLHADLRRVLVERLRVLPPDGGVDLASALAPIAPEEAARFGVPAGAALPPYLAPKVARSADGSLADLIERGVIASGEVLARVLPQVTSQLRAEALEDADARRLYVALYTAFRRRRGLLLLNYQHQVRFDELPWVAPLEAARTDTTDAKARARQTVAATSALALQSFPYTIVPNKLVTELVSLTNAAGLKLPLVEELAADIFMGGFSSKFAAAAQVSARVLAGTLYARYYAIDVDELARLPVVEGRPSMELAAICERRAAPLPARTGRSVARNGEIIEQAQILTTHNLAVLFDALAMREALGPHVTSIAKTCLTWATRRLRLRTTGWHQMLINFKNAAYAWRQMLFYLSFSPEVPAFVSWARAQVARADEPFRRRFEPVLRGLELAAAGVPSSTAAFAGGGGRVFTGWSTDRHWLAPERTGAPT